MKKNILFLTLIIILLNGAYAISSDIKDSYEGRETIIGELSGAILSNIPKSAVELVKDGHVQVAFEYDIRKLGEKYYVWLIAPQNSGNYTLIINDIASIENGVQKEVDYEKDFIVSENLTDYSVKPAAIFSSEDFYVTISLYEEAEKEISVDFPSQRNIVLEQGENRIDFSIDTFEGTRLININLGKYVIPAYIVGSDVQNGTNNGSEINEGNAANNSSVFERNYSEKQFVVEPRAIRAVVLTNADYSVYSFEIKNIGKSSLENIELNYDSSLFSIQPGQIGDLEVNTSAYFNLSLKNSTGERIRDVIYITSGNESDYLIIDINFTENENEVSTNYLNGSSSEALLYCSEIQEARLCINSEEKCNGESVSSLDGGICCKGSCEIEEESKAWIGYLVIAIAILALLGIYLKYKKAKPRVNPLDMIGKMPLKIK